MHDAGHSMGDLDTTVDYDEFSQRLDEDENRRVLNTPGTVKMDMGTGTYYDNRSDWVDTPMFKQKAKLELSVQSDPKVSSVELGGRDSIDMGLGEGNRTKMLGITSTQNRATMASEILNREAFSQGGSGRHLEGEIRETATEQRLRQIRESSYTRPPLVDLKKREESSFEDENEAD